MTLFRQIIIILSFFQTIILTAVMWQNLNTANEFIQDQLEVDARHTANSLGLSITPAASKNDIVTIETMINSMFDGGYYESIILKDAQGKILLSKVQQMAIADTPSWFVDVFKLKAPEAKSQIMAGWNIYGTLYVKNNLGIAYRQLWSTFKDILFVFVFFTLLAFVILFISLRVILKPLKFVQEQARAIAGNNFIFQENIPSTTELKQVVGAMNGMVHKVKEIFLKEAGTVKKYHEILYKDVESELYNKRYLVLKLQEYLASEEESFGSLVFASFASSKDIKLSIGYKKAEELKKEISAYFNDLHKEYKNLVIAKMSDEDFGFIFPNCNCLKIYDVCEKMAKDLSETIVNFGLDEDKFYFNFGIVSYGDKSKVYNIFSRADFALTTSKAKGKFQIDINSSTDENVLGKEAWKSEILNAMDDRRFIFAMQKVVDGADELYHNEIFLRLEDKEGNIKNAAYFMPMVNELKLNYEIDKYVLDRIIDSLEQETFLSTSLGINIGKEILLNSSNLAWFEEKLKLLKTKATNPVSFEISSRNKLPINLLAHFSKLLKRHGFDFGLDSFSLDGDSLKILQEVNPAYIKVQATSILDLLGDKHADSSKQSLDIITSSMDIKIIAFGVQSQKEKDMLYKMGIEYVQGNYIEKPYVCMN